VQSAFVLQGEESEATIDQINIESMNVVTPVSISGLRASHIGTVHFEGVTLAQNSAGLILWDASSGKIEALTVYYCNIDTTDWSIIKFGSNVYGGATFNPQTCNMLQIGTLHLKGLNNGRNPDGSIRGTGLTPLSNIWFVARPVMTGLQYCKIDRYVWNTFLTDQAVYQAFPSDPQANITFLSAADGPEVGRLFPVGVFGPGWVMREDGILEQFGSFTVAANSTVTVTFPRAHKDMAFYIEVNPNDTSTASGAAYRINANPVNATTFQVVSTASGAISGRWHSIGR
jgi:hypothetical protein